MWLGFQESCICWNLPRLPGLYVLRKTVFLLLTSVAENKQAIFHSSEKSAREQLRLSSESTSIVG